MLPIWQRWCASRGVLRCLADTAGPIAAEAEAIAGQAAAAFESPARL
jgi:hypothetical protein